MKRLLSILMLVFVMANGSTGYAQNLKKSDFLNTYSYSRDNQKYVYVIYKFEELNSSNGEIDKEYRLMLISSDLLGYSNCDLEGSVKESNGAFFINIMYAQFGGEFGVIYNDTYYIIGDPLNDDLWGEIKSAKFFPDSMSVTFINDNDVKKTVKLSSLPEEQKIKVKSMFY